MARAALTTEPSKVYVGMLIATCAAMLVGIVTMALEASEYDWMQKPNAVASPALPQPPKTDSAAIPKPDVLAAEPAKPSSLTPSPIQPLAPAPLPAVVTAPVKSDPPKPVVEDKPSVTPLATPPAPVPSGPVPSPFNPGR